MKTETASPRWEYSRYRATLKKNGEFVGLLSTVDGQAINEERADELLRAVNAYDALVEALAFYMAICGNTAYSTTRESAMEAYEMGKKALALAKEGKC